MNRPRRPYLGDIPQNLRPEKVERAQQIPFTAEPEQQLQFKGQQYQPPALNIPPQMEGKARNIALRGRFSQQVVNITDKPKSPLNANPKRVYFLVQNNGSFDVFINFGNKATTGNIRIVPNGNYEPFICPVDSISLVCASGNVSACAILEAVEVM